VTLVTEGQGNLTLEVSSCRVGTLALQVTIA